jgi:signal transduction histidine kinase
MIATEGLEFFNSFDRFVFHSWWNSAFFYKDKKTSAFYKFETKSPEYANFARMQKEVDNKILIESLNERIKELTCLYDISSISSSSTSSLEEILQAVAERVSQAWMYSEHSVVQILLDAKKFTSGKIPKSKVVLTDQLTIQGLHRGSISVYYPSPPFSNSDFLEEEKKLLTKIGQEIKSIVSRFDSEAKEEELRRSLEHSDRLSILGEITAGIAHELNTPLGNILGFSQLISKNATNSQIEQDAHKITRSAIYAREVVKKLMFFSCEMPQQKEMRSVNQLVSEAAKLLSPKLKENRLKLDLKLDNREPWAMVDPIQFTQIVFNLLINAIHASKRESQIGVEVSSDKKNYSLTISDEGEGISPELGEKIFEPFFTTKPVGQGSGLGLSVVHGIVKSHKGSIHYSSDPGRGTTFNVTLPLKP